ncbi:MAG TPA: BTAD domain-containing putative transcriptional regulator [Actinomycetes bacterium]|nr:BTAD domain-containing putative transcriptional regulator [Actinomycetes bacterium]
MTGARAALEFRVLGRLEVRHGGEVLEVGSARRRALLAQLLLDANRFVPRDSLVARCWNGAPPEDAAATLERDVSSLRSALDLRDEAGAPPALVAGPGGRAYRLEVDPGSVDAARFERLVEQGRGALAQGAPERAADAFDQALALWRDQPLADLTDAYGFVAAAGRWFGSLRLIALEGSLQAALELGRSGELVERVRLAVREHPGRASLRELEVRALYQAGRRDDALAAYQELRELRGEPALDGGPAREALERRVGRGDRSGSARRPPRGFVGRGPALGRLRAALQVARTRRGLLVLLHGDPGSGRSTLAARFAAEAAAAGALVAAASPLRAAGPRAFRPWSQVLGVILAAAGAPEDAGARALLDRWRDAAAAGEEDGDAASPAGREQQFETVTAALREAAADRLVVLVLDDVDEADAPSLRLLEHVARRLHGSRLLLLAVYQDHADGTAGWPATLRRLRRLPGTDDLPLPVLETREAAELIEAELARAPRAVAPVEAGEVSDIARRGRGNPLLTVELARVLAGGGLPVVDGPAAVAPLVRDAVRVRAARLPEPCRELLALAAVLGVESELEVLRSGADLPDADLDEQIRTAAGARLLEPDPDRPGTLRFSHPLVREALDGGLPDDRRAELHGRAAAAIERAHRGALGDHAEQLARLWSQAGGEEATRRAHECALLAGRRARAMLAWEEAARLLELARDTGAGHLAPDARCRLLLDLGAALDLAGEQARASARLLEAAALAKRIDDAGLLARAALGLGNAHSRLTAPGGPDRSALLLDEALAMVGDGDPALRSRLLASLARVLVWSASGQQPQARARRESLSGQAVAIARELGDDRALCGALVSRFNATWEPDNAAQRRELCDELVALAERAGEVEQVLEGRRGRLVAAMELGDLAAARTDLRACIQLAEGLRLPWHLYWAAIHQATLAMAEGRFERAEAATLRALAYGNRLESRDPGYVQHGVAVQLLLRCREQGRLPGEEGPGTQEDVERSLLSFVSDFPHLPAWRAGFALLAALSGRLDEGWEIFQELAAAGFDRLGGGAPWLGSVATLAELCALLRDADRAEELRALLLPHADRDVVVTFGFGCLGSAAHFLGQLESVLGEWKEADEHFQGALDRNLRLAAPPLVARTQVEYARMLLTGGLSGQRERALELLTMAGATAERLGMLPLQRQITELARD